MVRDAEMTHLDAAITRNPQYICVTPGQSRSPHFLPLNRKTLEAAASTAVRGFAGPSLSDQPPYLTRDLASSGRRRAESNRRTRICSPLPKPLGHAAQLVISSGADTLTRLDPASLTSSRSGHADGPLQLVVTR